MPPPPTGKSRRNPTPGATARAPHPPARKRLPWLLLLGVLPAWCQVQEFSTFRLTGVEGHVSTGWRNEEWLSEGQPHAGGPETRLRQEQSELRGEIYLMTHSYVYHPKLLSLDIGGGPVFSSQRSISDDWTGTSRDILYNLTARARLLADKPLRGTLFFERVNPTPALSPLENFSQQNDRYGLTADLLAPLTPVPLTMEVTRQHNRGRSVLRRTDDRIDDFSLRGERALGKWGETRFGYHGRRQESASGSLDLPILRSRLDAQEFDVNTRLDLGDRRQYLFNNHINFSRQSYSLLQGPAPHSDNLRFVLTFHGTHTATLRSNASYSLGRSRQDQLNTRLNNGQAGLTWSPTPELSVYGQAQGDDERSEQFSMRVKAAGGGLHYSRALPLGALAAGYALRYEDRSQESAAGRNVVVGESLTLALTTQVALSKTRVTAGSVTVRNATRSQVYVEGVDYLLTVVGITTRIQRLLSGRILDGEKVLVDYDFDFGGTYASTQVGQDLNLTWSMSPLLSLYARYSSVEPRLVSGTPVTPLNPIRDTVYGARTDVTLGATGMVVGGYVERRNHRATIDPYVRSEVELHVQGDLPSEVLVNYRLARRRARVTGDNPLQNSNLSGYDLMLGWRHISGVSITGNLWYERDTGQPEIRERKTATLQAMWYFRRLTFSLNLARTHEVQGLFRRDRNSGNAMLRRDF